jgi:hypothetical protein
VELLARLARRKHQQHGLGQQASRHKRKRLRRGPIQPLSIVDDAHQRPVLRHVRHQGENGEADQKAIRWWPHVQAEHRLEGAALRVRQTIEPIEQRRKQLMHSRKRQLHLGLHAPGSDHPQVRRRLDRVVQQCRFPHPGIATDDDHAAAVLTHAGKQLGEHRQLFAPPSQPRLPTRRGATVNHERLRILTKVRILTKW